MILPVVGLHHLCAEEALIFYLKSICGNKATRHLQLNIHFNLRSTYTYTYTISQKKSTHTDSYALFMLLWASISALYSLLVELQGSNHGHSGEAVDTEVIKGKGRLQWHFCESINAVMQALKLKFLIFTDFHPVLLQVGVEMLYLLAILGGVWKLELIQR